MAGLRALYPPQSLPEGRGRSRHRGQEGGRRSRVGARVLAGGRILDDRQRQALVLDAPEDLERAVGAAAVGDHDVVGVGQRVADEGLDDVDLILDRGDGDDPRGRRPSGAVPMSAGCGSAIGSTTSRIRALNGTEGVSATLTQTWACGASPVVPGKGRPFQSPVVPGSCLAQPSLAVEGQVASVQPTLRVEAGEHCAAGPRTGTDPAGASRTLRSSSAGRRPSRPRRARRGRRGTPCRPRGQAVDDRPAPAAVEEIEDSVGQLRLSPEDVPGMAGLLGVGRSPGPGPGRREGFVRVDVGPLGEAADREYPPVREPGPDRPDDPVAVVGGDRIAVGDDDDPRATHLARVLDESHVRQGPHHALLQVGAGVRPPGRQRHLGDDAVVRPGAEVVGRVVVHHDLVGRAVGVGGVDALDGCVDGVPHDGEHQGQRERPQAARGLEELGGHRR